MIDPFTSYAWSAFAGKYAQSFVHLPADWVDSGTLCAKRLLAYPKGRRVAFFQNIEGNLFHNAADNVSGQQSLWWPKGIAERRATATRIFDQMVAGKTTLDFLVLDIESIISGWNLTPADRAAIQNDPRYAALVATGDFPADCRNFNEATLMQFNYGCFKLADAAITAAIITPLLARFPKALWSNFNDFPITKADAAFVPEQNGHAAFYAASHASVYAPVLYAYVNQLGQRDARFKEPWYCLALNANTLRAAYRAKPSAKVMPWVAPRVMSNVLDNDYWQEMILHVCCLCGPLMLYFNADDFSALSNWRLDHALSQYAGQAGGKAWVSTLVTAFTDYDKATYVLSAARLADKSIVGRVSFKPGVNSATVTLGGKTVTVKRSTGSVGAWFRLA